MLTNVKFGTMNYIANIKLTAVSKWNRARSRFFVCVNSTVPSWRCVLVSMRGGGLKVNTVCKQWIHNLMFGGFDVLKFSASPNNDKYHGSTVPDAILLSFRWCLSAKHEALPCSKRSSTVNGYFNTFENWIVDWICLYKFVISCHKGIWYLFKYHTIDLVVYVFNVGNYSEHKTNATAILI